MVKIKPQTAICTVVATGGILCTVNFDINNSERVIAVLGYFDTSGVRGLVFFTSLGRVYGPYGGCTGENFRVWSCQVRGVYSSETLVSIGLYCTHVKLIILKSEV